MKKRRETTTKVGLMLLIFAGLAIAFLPLQAWAQDDVDTDGDGIMNLDEISVCPDFSSSCVATDPAVADLFVVFTRADDSWLPPIYPNDISNPDNLFSFMPLNFTDVNGNVRSLTTHVFELRYSPTSQAITSNQNAVALKEDTRTSDGDLGTSQVGIPTAGVSGTVFSYRIYEDVATACNLQIAENCVAVNPNLPNNIIETGVENIFKLYAQNVVAHETFHMVNRVVPPNSKVDNHYPQLGYIMDHHMYYKEYKKDKKVVWYITNTWERADRPQFK